MKYIFISGLIILAGFLLALSYIPLGIEPLTEVYFENHTSLPKHIFLNKNYGFEFTINNLEYQDMKYEYVVQAFNEQGQIIYESGSGTVIIPDNKSLTIYEEFLMEESFDRAKIQITIKKIRIREPEFKDKLWWEDPNYPEQIKIHFWVEEIVPTRIIITED